MRNLYVGKNSKIWEPSNVYGSDSQPVRIGQGTQIGAFSEIKPGVTIGDNCRLQYGVFLPTGVKIYNNVFVGPRVTFTNDKHPDIEKTLKGEWRCLETIVDSFVSIGAGSTILPVHIKMAAQVGAGSVVTKDVDEYSIVVGNPARKIGDVRENKYKHLYRHIANPLDQ